MSAAAGMPAIETAPATNGRYRVVETLFETQSEQDIGSDMMIGDEPAAVMAPKTLASAVRVSIVERGPGEVAVVCKRSSFVHLYRASGRECTFWRPESVQTLFRTKSDMVVLRHSSGSGRPRVVTSERLFGSDRRSAALEVRTALNGSLRYQEVPRAEITAIGRRIVETIGPAPIAAQRFPLLASDDGAGFATKLDDVMAAPALYQDPWLDCADAAQVARKLFGARQYRRPLAREVARVSNHTLVWYSLFRGLVPPEWIIDALRAVPDVGVAPRPRELSSKRWRTLRALLVRTPQPVLRRILKEPLLPLTMVLDDTAKQITDSVFTVRSMADVEAVIAATKQRHIRSSQELHDLVMRMPADPHNNLLNNRGRAARAVIERERELEHNFVRVNRHRVREGTQPLQWEQWQTLPADEQDAMLVPVYMREDADRQRQRQQFDEAQRRREQAEEQARRRRIAADTERATWAAEATAKIEQAGTLGGLDAVVASNGRQLRGWGTTMHNCIGSYERELGLDVLLGLFRDGKLVANAEINRRDGVVQLLGRYNQDFETATGLGIDLGRHVLADLEALGIPASPGGWGLAALIGPFDGPDVRSRGETA